MVIYAVKCDILKDEVEEGVIIKKIYACLIGEWVCLNDDPECNISSNFKSPSIWWEENAEIWSLINRSKDLEHSASQLDYVNILYKRKNYRINPTFIQVVTE